MLAALSTTCVLHERDAHPLSRCVLTCVHACGCVHVRVRVRVHVHPAIKLTSIQLILIDLLHKLERNRPIQTMLTAHSLGRTPHPHCTAAPPYECRKACLRAFLER